MVDTRQQKKEIAIQMETTMETKTCKMKFKNTRGHEIMHETLIVSRIPETPSEALETTQRISFIKELQIGLQM